MLRGAAIKPNRLDFGVERQPWTNTLDPTALQLQTAALTASIGILIPWLS
jgi:hypothetical protein